MSDKIHIDPQVKEYIALAKEAFKHILKYWYLLIIFLILASVVGNAKKEPTTTKYVATLTFTINQQDVRQETTEEGQVASLITDFGTGRGNNNLRVQRLIELSKSNAVLSAVLFRTYEVEGDTNYLANHFLNIYNLNVTDSTYYENFTSLDSLNRVEIAVLNGILNQMRGRNVMFTISPAQIYKLTTSSVKEELSKVMAEAYYDALSDLYIQGAISKAQANYESSEERLVSARNSLLGAEAALANWQDQNRNLIKRTAFLSEKELQRQVQINNRAYQEALSGFNMAKVNLDNLRPLFQMIDPPRYPLKRQVSGGGSMYKIAMVAAVALFFMITLALFAYKKYGYLLKEILEA